MSFFFEVKFLFVVACQVVDFRFEFSFVLRGLPFLWVDVRPRGRMCAVFPAILLRISANNSKGDRVYTVFSDVASSDIVCKIASVLNLACIGVVVNITDY